MKIRLKPRRSFRYNAQPVVRFLWKKFKNRAAAAAKDRGSVEKLHRMRIAGKRLRDMMELCLPFAGGEFKTAYNRLKDVASLLGKIHDLDDAANILRKNKNIPGTGKIVRFVRARRKILYLKFKKAQRKFEKPGVEDLIKN